uniref:ERAP1-like C-terminal domain-containing protein n=1 Tax=Plectus sambesii TaxID=2011161 RepID=A0A914WWW4_9BILA
MNTRRFEITDIGLLVDGRPTTQPVVTNQNPFSGVTYYKGSSLLDMLSYTLGANVFQQGLKLYVQKFAYSNANHDDLWACLTQAAAANGILDWNSTPLNVGNLMNPYILQKTFPVLKVVNENGVIRYYQEPFVARSLLSPSIYNYTWNMPIFTQMSNQPTQYVFDYFTGISSKSTRGVVGTWTVQNAGFRSFMRVWYDDSTWAPILNQLNSDPSVFEVKTRAMFLSDTYALIGRGSLPWPRLLDLTLYLTKETDQAPWNAVRGAFDSLIGNLKYQPEYSMLLTYLRNLTKPAYIQKGWVNGGLWDINILSAQVTSLACQAGYTTCLSAANHYFSLFAAQCSNSVSGTNDCNPLKPDLRRSMYCFGVAQNKSYWDVANNLYNKATKLEFYFTEETDNLLYGMSCSTDQLTLTSMLRYAVGGKYQNPATVLRYIAANDLGPNAMWAYVTTSTAEVVNGVPNFDQFVLPMVSHWNSQAQLARMQGFLSTPQATAAFSANEVAVWNRAIAQVQTNIAWVSNTKPAIAQWLQTNFGS